MNNSISTLSSVASPFRVLNREELVHRHLLLEASAGTGKTFAIEHIVTRLLLESTEGQDALPIERILVVTFTRLAARELKERIRSNLEKNLERLKKEISPHQQTFPDYLLAIIERGDQAVRQAKKRLEQALFSFDSAQIFTIHGFCWRMLKTYALEAGISLDSSSKEDHSLSTAKLMQAIRDFLRRGLPSSAYSCQQLKILMKRANNRSEKLQEDLFRQINRGMPIMAPPPFDRLLPVFQEQMALLLEKAGCKGQQILEDFRTLVPSYKELRDNSKQIHPEKWEKALRFASLFDKQEWHSEDFEILIEDGLFFLEAFDPCQRMAKAKPLPPEALHVPDLLDLIRVHLASVVAQARQETGLFARLACDCQQFILHYQEDQEMFGHQELLIRMQQSLRSPRFIHAVRSQYRAAIVDEFQDTDPIQWDIFSSLFISENEAWKGYLHLVGDPKQSIYAFRQADIYTYLGAAQKLGSNSRAILDTNFRSNSSLIDALNILFKSASDLFPLPRKALDLPYHEVKAGRGEAATSEPSLHLWQVCYSGKARSPFYEIEAEFLLPAIAQEISSLNKNRSIRFSQCAILIADRYQAERVSDYLKAHHIPVKSQRGKELSSSSIKEEMRDLLKGILNYTNKGALNTALACRLIGMSHHELELLEDPIVYFPVAEKFHSLKSILLKDGFARFYDAFMRSIWHADNKSILERLLEQSGGKEIYREWQDLADLIIAEESSKSLLPHGILAFLDELEELALNEEDRIKAYVDPYEDGVAIMTTFMSKGLEYDFVFALGLANRTRSLEDDLIIIETSASKTIKENPQGLMLGPAEHENDPAYQRHCEESDAEKMRLLYVALTRAREHLYVPIVIYENKKPVKIGSASSIDLLMAKIASPTTDYQALYQRIAEEDGSPLLNLAAAFPSLFTVSLLNPQPNSPNLSESYKLLKLYPPKKVQLPCSHFTLQSFTSLTYAKKGGQSAEIAESNFQEEMLAPHDFYAETKTGHTLPAGNDTGMLLHTIFEKLSFDYIRSCTSPEELIPLIAPFLQNTSFAAWEVVIADLVFNALKVDLGHGFCLADVPREKTYKEMEFLYPHDRQREFQEAKPGFLKGVVDLFFEHQGKFYLVDWKSNWLGPSHEHYQKDHLQEAMRCHRYDLQAAIYQEACRRYIKLFNKRHFEDCFGGVYYLFVRGISSQTGVLHVR